MNPRVQLTLKSILINVCGPFIRERYNDDNYALWPDLASCHYSFETIEYLESQNIIYVPKDDNPPNVPQTRLIEEFWANLEDKVYDKEKAKTS